MMNDENKPYDAYTKATDDLLATDSGLDIWAWLRMRTSKLIECENPGLEEIGSSDVSCRLYELWKDQYQLTGMRSWGTREWTELGFNINSEVMGYID
tara:strand:- start:173 stop:463 length:291 start_codon:yes stop_codon:yes gene_type:complete